MEYDGMQTKGSLIIMSHKLIPPTEQEDKVITKAALSDPDNLPLSDNELLAMHPVKARGPQKSPTKIPVSIRLTPDVVRRLSPSNKQFCVDVCNDSRSHALRGSINSGAPALESMPQSGRLTLQRRAL